MRTLYSITEATGINRLFAHLNRTQPIVLAFHGVTAEAPGNLCNHEGKHLYLPIFERLMEHVARNYAVVPLAQVADWVDGRAKLPENAVALTFDDGYRNVFTNAAPVLKRLGMPSTLFVVTDFVFHQRMLWPDRLMSAIAMTHAPRVSVPASGGQLELPLGDDRERRAADAYICALCKRMPEKDKQSFLDYVIGEMHVPEQEIIGAWQDHAPIQPDELRELKEYGMEIGSHTCSHGIVTRFTPDAMTHELAVSKLLLEQVTGRPCAEFSYPNGAIGDFNDESRTHVTRAGYRCAVTTVKRRVARGDDRYQIPRCILTHNQITTAEFSAHVSGLPAFLRAVRARVTGAGPAQETAA
ncbi:MAG: polysaccharide deacetylase family protein [Candidatus Krumholzibacteria bacterium]|nr:polysaccharide deacetylase family protein [Candidatus Krumholzibacteria bacterium]MDH4335738.1 polysaccharide deacetylase family protein [Candidatus Krumholzibacteria bacterium]MDH5269264.1 polysaccharide deacetylase family protein [Candidatus Krumholzibacteria bacterium]MDH5627614.1 polysaccharide deacetylase family protein [Candidatus Krumholzibacteria bacterium]